MYIISFTHIYFVTFFVKTSSLYVAFHLRSTNRKKGSEWSRPQNVMRFMAFRSFYLKNDLFIVWHYGRIFTRNTPPSFMPKLYKWFFAIMALYSLVWHKLPRSFIAVHRTVVPQENISKILEDISSEFNSACEF